MDNNLRKFGWIAFVMVSVLLLVITSSGVWNAVALKSVDPFYGWIAGVNFIVSAFFIWRYFKDKL